MGSEMCIRDSRHTDRATSKRSQHLALLAVRAMRTHNLLTLDDEQSGRDDVTDDVGRHTLVDALVAEVQVPDGQVAGVQYRP